MKKKKRIFEHCRYKRQVLSTNNTQAGGSYPKIHFSPPSALFCILQGVWCVLRGGEMSWRYRLHFPGCLGSFGHWEEIGGEERRSRNCSRLRRALSVSSIVSQLPAPATGLWWCLCLPGDPNSWVPEKSPLPFAPPALGWKWLSAVANLWASSLSRLASHPALRSFCVKYLEGFCCSGWSLTVIALKWERSLCRTMGRWDIMHISREKWGVDREPPPHWLKTAVPSQREGAGSWCWKWLSACSVKCSNTALIPVCGFSYSPPIFL